MITINDTADMTQVIAAQSIVGVQGSQALIVLAARLTRANGNTGYKFLSLAARLENAFGERPLVRGPTAGAFWSYSAGKPQLVYSYDAWETWQYFDTPPRYDAAGGYIEWQNSTPFLYDTVDIAVGAPLSSNAQTGRWVDGLIAQYPGIVYRVPMTPLVAQTDERGRVWPGETQHVFTIGADGSNKPWYVVMLSQHANEGMGHLWGARSVEFLLSADPAAVALRAAYQGIVVGQQNPMGRLIGHHRGQAKIYGSGGYNDPNRVWNVATPFDCVAVLRDKLDELTGGAIDWALDYHAADLPPAVVGGALQPESGSGGTTGSGAVATNSGDPLVIGNRDGGDRTFNGSIAFATWWDRILTLGELLNAQRDGPGSIPGAILLWAGQDWSNSHLVPVSRTAITIKAGPPFRSTLGVGIFSGLPVGFSPSSGTLKTYNGLAKASIKTFQGLAKASTKTVNGLTP